MKYNTRKESTRTVNRAGGDAYKQSPELELVSLLLTSFVQDKYYESEGEQLGRLESLVKTIKDKEFLAKAAVYARNEFNMRSITHALLAEIVQYVKGETFVRRAIDKGIIRPDDATEVVAYYINKYGRRPLPNSLKRGVADSLQKFDQYQLAKYRGDKNSVKLVDLVNLTHYKPTVEQAMAIKELMGGELKSTETWEGKMTAVGKEAKSEEEKAEKKTRVWEEMLVNNKLGYLAILRNLRNFLSASDEVVEMAIEQLRDPRRIKNSRVLPFRFSTAYAELAKVSGASKILAAIDDAADIALDNVPEFSGKTLVALDGSGSMSGKPWKIGALFAAAIVKRNPGADLKVFSTGSRNISINPKTPVMEVARNLRFPGGGTNFRAIFDGLKIKYDRIVVLSDMQGWVESNWLSGGGLRGAVNYYKDRTGADPFIYSFDLQGYGDMKFPEDKVFCLAGFSEKIFDVMGILERDRKALIEEIRAVRL